MTARHPRRRGGFTLIEMLVAMGIAILLLGIIVAVTQSGFMGSFRTVRAADRVSQWLVTAKNRAARDGVPRGLRFYVSDGRIGEAQYIELPPTWTLPTPTTGRLIFEYKDTAFNQTNPTSADFKLTYVGDDPPPADADTLLIPDLGASYSILSMTPVAPYDGGGGPKANTFDIRLFAWPNLGAGFTPTTPPVPGKTGTYATSSFGFHVGPRPMFGDPPLLIGQDLAIEPQLCFPKNPPGPPPALQTIDIVFAPSGQVMFANYDNRDISGAFIALWVRDISTNPAPNDPAFSTAGEQVLVVVYPKTGLISTQQVKPVAGQEYDFAKDGINTGL